MSIARHHAEWLSLLEISGPFLSLPALMETFPQGLDADDPDLAAELRAAYEEWADNQGGLQPDPAIHTAWVRYVLGTVLEMGAVDTADLLLSGQAIPAGLKASVAEHHETLRPDLILRAPEGGAARLLVQVYPPQQELEKPVAGRNWKAAPSTRMMELLHATQVRLGLVTNGEQWLLVSAQRGATTGYISWYASLWLEERLTLRAFRSLLGVYRFFGVPQAQTLEALLDASANDQQEVTDQLGYQVRRAVELLVQAIDRADQDRGRALLHGVSERLLYETAVSVMMRLVVLLAAEERGLLLLGDPIYDQYYAVSTLRAQLRETADRSGEELLERRYDAWCRLLAAFRAVYGGVQHENMRLPAYGGALFDPDRYPFLEGRPAGSSASAPQPADPLPINNRTVLHLLEALQMLEVQAPGGGPKQARRLSFRALDIEQIGHVYEGLLDHEARRAAEPVVGLQGAKNKEPEVPLPQLEQFGTFDAQADAPGANQLDKLLDFLEGQTGRSRSALRNALQTPHSALRTPHSAFRTPHSALRTPHSALTLRVACGNDEALYRRVRPWRGLVRDDDYGYPVVIPAGSVYVTAGPSRRATGTHYTPRSLTEPIVQHTLEPLAYVGPAEGLPREQWQLRPAAELLRLKLCDMAMGSGAFLVQMCRYMAERLLEAWQAEAVAVGAEPTADRPFAGAFAGQNLDELYTLAKRLVAERCLYGVDKNPLAVEMAKLSLWLVTLSKNKPFTFVDHALRHGDSLIGAEEDAYNRWWHSLKGTVGPLYGEETEKALHEARRLRRELQTMQVLDVQDAQRKADLLTEAEAATARIRRACDLLVGVQLLGLNQTEQEAWRQKLLIEHVGSETMTSPEAQQALVAAQKNDAFHWFVEFPEVFAQDGFSAFVGNPPFMWGMRISTYLGNDYYDYLKNNVPIQV